MAKNGYDAIVVGARCAGSPTAMLLARKGYNVLVVDRATFPSDTISTHLVHPLGVAALERWGVLEEVIASGCPAIHTYAFDFGPVTIEGTPGTSDSPVAYSPRRIVLDKILVDAAVRAGAEVREGFTVDDVLIEDGRVIGIRGHGHDGKQVNERARVVVGADGRHSRVAEAVRAEQYNEKDPLLCGYYAYWSDLEMNGRFETFIRDRRGWAAMPTNDGLTLLVGGWPQAEFAANKRDVEGNYRKMFEQDPAFNERLTHATRETRVVGTTVPNFFRKPYGPGWVLVGDAGYNKDPITAQGILDAFRDVEQVTNALDEAFTGARSFDDGMSDYQRARDEHVLPMYEFTTQLATLEMNAGTISPAQFFAEANVGAILAASGANPGAPH